ncbi:MAG: glycosyltransferase [Fimbriimonadales bacterium]
MRVLMVSLSLPPFAESQTIRSAYMIEAMAQAGVECELLTAEVVPSQADETLMDILPPNCRIWRTAPPPYDQRLNSLIQRGNRRFAYFYANLAYRLLAPDIRRGWEKQAIALAESVLPKVRPDVLFSASGSCTAHLACAAIKSRWNLPWIADFGDPWSWVDWQHWDTWIKAIQNSRLERRTLPDIDQMVVTTEPTADAYQAKRGLVHTRPLVVPFGYRAVEFPSKPLQRSSAPVQIAYVGSASRRARNLNPLIRALSELRHHPCQFRLQIVGSVSHHFLREAHQSGLKDVEITGRVSYRDSLTYIREAGLLVLIGNNSPYQIPGKTFHYLASGRPILYLAQMPSEQDPTARLLRAFPGVRMVFNTQEAIHQFLSSLTSEAFQEWEYHAQTHPNLPELLQYEIHTAIQPLLDWMSVHLGGHHAARRS